MKKIVFVLPHMLCGGVEKALLSLINEMPEDKYQISIILAEMEGDFLNQIPANISVDLVLSTHSPTCHIGGRSSPKMLLNPSPANS